MQRQVALISIAAFTAVCGYCQTSAPADDEIGVLKVQGNVYMLVTPAGNIAAQVGDDGILVVNTGTQALAPKVAAALKKIADKPVLWVVNTDAGADHLGGNEALPRLSGLNPRLQPRIVAYENVLDRVTQKKAQFPEPLWPNDEYFRPTKDFSFNGEAVEVYHAPNALTDGDSLVHFRRSDVLATGDVFTPGLYPKIDLEQGGTIQGLLDALNQILRITVPLKYEEAGTYVIPGRGRLCDEADVVEFRNMVTIVRDRVHDLVRKDKTLEQVVAAKPTWDYDTQYDAQSADAFVTAIYKTLTSKK
ncbi:MAG TPA: MBL fold metallo-hydrolase [Bryobacteraceae bacterium]|nr:MBL fold metallo-hydrolase [Bryobacteraceae bacterium]HUO29315.1 MBL fold metallo-hydrolase [Bryobacteraceae bacterium]